MLTQSGYAPDFTGAIIRVRLASKCALDDRIDDCFASSQQHLLLVFDFFVVVLYELLEKIARLQLERTRAEHGTLFLLGQVVVDGSGLRLTLMILADLIVGYL